MRYAEHPPPDSVAAYVVCLWTLTGAVDRPTFDLILPDGRPELVVHRGDAFRQRLSNGAARVQPRQLVVGQMTGGVAIAPGRRVESIGVRFTPAGLAPLCPFPQRRLVDCIARADRPRAPLVRGLAAAAAAAPTLDAALDALRRGLPRAYEGTPSLDRRLVEAIERLTAAGGMATVDDLTRGLGVSPRWLERHFHAAVGVTPKQLGRLVRFRRAVAALDANPSRAGAVVALDHGYYDQAHFIADFRAFAGDAPRRFVEHRLAELTRYFVDRGVRQ
jgi:methylphosphotriester-DNA--protein-cysteine methyltransferase